MFLEMVNKSLEAWAEFAGEFVFFFGVLQQWLILSSKSVSPSAVIAGGVIGFLFAIFLILLLVYRMRKKDEGSYDLGERKPSGAAYQKAPTKEFYAWKKADPPLISTSNRQWLSKMQSTTTAHLFKHNHDKFKLI